MYTPTGRERERDTHKKKNKNFHSVAFTTALLRVLCA